MELRFGREEGALPTWSEASARATAASALSVIVFLFVAKRGCFGRVLRAPSCRVSRISCDTHEGEKANKKHTRYPSIVLKTYRLTFVYM